MLRVLRRGRTVQSGLSYAQAINSVTPRAAARAAAAAAAAGDAAAAAGRGEGASAAGGAAAGAHAPAEGGARAGAGGAEAKLRFTLGGLPLIASSTIFQAVQVSPVVLPLKLSVSVEAFAVPGSGGHSGENPSYPAA
jgi:hypothetical protein